MLFFHLMFPRSIYIYKNKCCLLSCLLGQLVADYLLLLYFGPYGVFLMNMCVVIAVAVDILLRDFGPY